jgi:hypothetical protein
MIEKNYNRNFPSDKLNSSKAATLGLYFEVERAPEKATLMQFLKKGTAEQKIQATQIAEFGLAKDPKYAEVLIEARTSQSFGSPVIGQIRQRSTRSYAL